MRSRQAKKLAADHLLRPLRGELGHLLRDCQGVSAVDRVVCEAGDVCKRLLSIAKMLIGATALCGLLQSNLDCLGIVQLLAAHDTKRLL